MTVKNNKMLFLTQGIELPMIPNSIAIFEFNNV